MKYLLCYIPICSNGRLGERESQIYEDFEEVILQYTLCCSKSVEVVLADINDKKILWQYSRSGRAVTSV